MVCGLGVTVHSSATQWINTEEMGIPCLLTFSYSIVTIQNKLHFANNPNLHPVLVKKKICCYQSWCEKSIHGLYNNSRAKWWRLFSSIRAKLSAAFLYLQSFKADLVQSRFGPESWGKVNFQNFEVFRTEVPRSGSSLMRNSLCISSHTKGILLSLTPLQLFDWKEYDTQEAKSPDWSTARKFPHWV